MGPFKRFVCLIFFFKLTKFDDLIRRLHYQWTSLIMLIGFFLIFVHQNIYRPIKCVASPPLKSKILSNYCWLNGTFYIFGRPDVRIELAQNSRGDGNTTSEVVKITADIIWKFFSVSEDGQPVYYPIGFFSYMLAMQGLTMFLFKFAKLPSRLYNHTYPYIAQLCREPLDKLDELGEKVFVLQVKTLVYSNWLEGRRNVTNWLQIYYSLGTVFEFFILNVSMQGAFLKLGFEWIAFITGHSQIDPLIRAFPSKARCFYSNHSHINLEVDCFIPLSSFIAKIYLIIWFWLFFLAIASVWYLLERIFYIHCTSCRIWYMEQIAPTIIDKPMLKKFVTIQTQYWYIFFLMSKNMNGAQKFNKMMYLIFKHSDGEKQLEDQRNYQEHIVNDTFV